MKKYVYSVRIWSWDGQSFVGVFSSEPAALKGAVDYLIDDFEYPKLGDQERLDNGNLRIPVFEHLAGDSIIISLEEIKD